MLSVGKKAPDFSLPDQFGQMVSLSSFLGKKVVLYFYPKDNTSGCTIEALSYAAAYPQFIEKDSIVIGISKDSVKSHLQFATQHDLPFILLADTKLEAIIAYDVWQDKQMYGKIYKGVHRTTYVIDEKGVIIKIYTKVDTKTNAQEVLTYLDEK